MASGRSHFAFADGNKRSGGLMNELGQRLKLTYAPVHSQSNFLRLLQLGNRRAGNNDVLDQLPDVIEVLAACLRGGMPLIDSLEWVSKRSSGSIASEFSDLLVAKAAGDTTTTALLNYESHQTDPHLRELAMKLALAEQLGSPVAGQLVALAQSLRMTRLSRLREIGAKKETRMMIPLVSLVLPVTVLFAVYPSLQFLQFQSL